jgi:hypothetical protein
MATKWMAVVVGAVVILLPGLAWAQTEWVDHPDNPALPAPDPADWDAVRNVDTVLEVNGTYHMYFTGRVIDAPFGELNDIGHATSSDGLSWEMDPANPVLTRGFDGEWDSGTVMEAAVIHDGTGFRMWYAGNDGEVAGVGYATSPDGSTWTKHAGNPIMDAGPAGSFDGGSIWPGIVLLDGQRYRMWYTGHRELGGFNWTIGYAESDDGLSWTRNSEPVVETGEGWDSEFVYAPWVLLDGPIHRMWYAGYGGSAIRIGYAESRDGVTWTKYIGNPVIERNYWTCNPHVLYDDSSGTYSMWYRNHDDDSFRLAISDCCTTVHASIIPAAAYAAGAAGSFYETDLDLANDGDLDAEYLFSWLPRGETNSDPVQSELFALGAGQSVRYANVLSEVFGLEPDAFGALRIDATIPDLNAMVRIANAPQQPDAGSFGQAMTAIRPSDCTGTDVRRRLVFGTEKADMRFNVGCVNASDSVARIAFELYSSDGTLLGTENVILRAWSNDQLNRIFDDYRPVTGYVDYWHDLPSDARVYCYGSLLDNVTSDPTTIPPM